MTAPALEQVTTARRRLTAIRNALGSADGLLYEAWAAKDWQTLGHPSWKAYCAEQLPELRTLSLRAEVRDPQIVAMALAGMSQGAIAEGLGIGRGTVNRALAGVELPDTVTATDGRVRAARAPKAAPKPLETRADQLVRLIAAAGTEGRTSAELERSLRLHHGIVSGALSRVARQGRIAHAGRSRGGYGVYVVG